MAKAYFKLGIDYKSIYANVWKQNPDIRKTYNRIQFPYLHNILDSVVQQFGKCITTTLYFSIYI